MARKRGITAGPDVDWSEFDIQLFYDTLARIVGEREGLDIKIKLTKKTDSKGSDDHGVSL